MGGVAHLPPPLRCLLLIFFASFQITVHNDEQSKKCIDTDSDFHRYFPLCLGPLARRSSRQLFTYLFARGHSDSGLYSVRGGLWSVATDSLRSKINNGFGTGNQVDAPTLLEWPSRNFVVSVNGTSPWT